MATELAAAYVTIIPSLKGAARQIQSELQGIDVSSVGKGLGKSIDSGLGVSLQSIGSRIRDVGSQISGVGRSLTQSITLPVAGAAAAVGGMVAALGWGRLKSIDSAQAQLKGLGYSAEDVERISGQLVQALEGGMLTMGEATSAAAAGMAAGVDEGAELTRYIQLLDAATAGSNGTFDEMNQIFARVQGSGRLMTSELNMIEQRMPGFSGAAAEAFGVTQEELRNMVTAGEVSADDFLDVMEGFAGGMATEYAKSWEGMVANTKAYIGIIGQSLLGGVFEQSKESIAEFIDYLKSDDVQAWAQDMGAKIGDAFGRVVESVRDVIDWWRNLDDSTKGAILKFAGVAVAAGPVLMVLGKITSVVGGVVGGLGTLVSWVSRLSPGLSGAAGGAGSFLRLLGRFAGPIGLVVTGLIGMWQNSEEFRTAVMGLGQQLWSSFQQIAGAIMPLLETIMSALGPLLGTIGDVVGGVITSLMPIIGTVVDLLGQIITAITPVVGAILSVLVPAIQDLMPIVKAVFGAVAKIVKSAMKVVSGIIDTVTAVIKGDWSGAWKGIQKTFSGVWDLIKNIVKGAINIVKTTISSVLNAIKGIFSSVWNGIKGVVASAINAVKSRISSVMNSIKSVWSNAWNSVKSRVSEIWNGIRSGVSNGISGVMDRVRGIRSSITGFFSGAGSWLLNAGRSIISGLVNGIRSMISRVTGAVGDVLSAARNLLPFSPAKEGPFSGKGWTLYSGRSIVEALAQGVLDEGDRFISATERVMSGAHAAIGGSSMYGTTGSGAFSGRGMYVENVHLTTASSGFSLEQVQERLRMAGAN